MAVSEGSLKQNTVFLQDTFRKAIFPAMLSLLSANINVFVDGILVGNKLGSEALAAINLSLPLYLMMCIVGSFLASGTAISAARAIGDNDPEKSQMYYQTCISSLFIASAVFTVVGLLFRKGLVGFLCSDEAVRPYVMEYVVITLIGAIPKIMAYIPFWYLRLDGKNGAITVMMVIMSIGNIILDYIFVYMWDMGVFGAGLASVIATTAAFIFGMLRLFSKSCSFRFKLFLFRDKLEWRVIASAGIPSALNNLLATLRLLIVNAVLLSYGGSAEVAVFTAVNGIAGFGECITLGIPQAATPMLGVFSGEQDNGSCLLLIRIELIVGAVFSGVFLLLCTLGSGAIRAMYALSEPMLLPLLWLGLSIFPALICTVISGYYNMAGLEKWSNLIIVLRGIVMTCVGLLCVTKLHLSTYFFLLFAELGTAAVWLAAVTLYRRKHMDRTKFLLMDMSLEERGSILNFSVSSDPEDICSASERISEFCETNGMNLKTTMRVQLAMEEIMTLIGTVNGPEIAKTISFDLRAYSLDGITGIRIRYGGKAFNPFNSSDEDDELYMGIMMLRKMVRSFYQRTFGVNTLQVTFRRT